MKKTTGYKYQIEQLLRKNNWEIIEISSSNNWWDDEHWLIKSTNHKNLALYICFIIDPQFEASGKKEDKIYGVRASKKIPDNWNDNTSSISFISLATRKFEIKLDAFMQDLKDYENI